MTFGLVRDDIVESPYNGAMIRAITLDREAIVAAIRYPVPA
jgi:hypothetical protein